MSGAATLAPTPAAAPTRGRRLRVRELIKDLLLWAAAGLGVVCLAWLGYAHFTGAQIIVFRTGSMSPALPQGAAAVAVPTQAEELEVGDVVTVEPLPGARPVTHRIVSIAPVAGRDQTRELVLKGDANSDVDITPYQVEWAPRVVGGVAHGGSTLEYLQSRNGLALVSVSVGSLLGWALWPSSGRRGGARRAEKPTRETGGAA